MRRYDHELIIVAPKHTNSLPFLQDAEAVGKALYTACRDVGFAYLINTTIPQEDIAGMFEWSAKFFSLPQETKQLAPHPPEGKLIGTPLSGGCKVTYWFFFWLGWRHRGYSGIGKEQVRNASLITNETFKLMYRH